MVPFDVRPISPNVLEVLSVVTSLRCCSLDVVLAIVVEVVVVYDCPAPTDILTSKLLP